MGLSTPTILPHLSRVPEPRQHRAACREVEIGVLKHNQGGVASELKAHALRGGGRGRAMASRQGPQGVLGRDLIYLDLHTVILIP